jgi:hypothetical protein
MTATAALNQAARLTAALYGDEVRGAEHGR